MFENIFPPHFYDSPNFEIFEKIIDEFLSHVTDDKPITARQCVKSLVEIGESKPNLIPIILSKLDTVDLSKYRDSMRPLIEKDIEDFLAEYDDYINYANNKAIVAKVQVVLDDAQKNGKFSKENLDTLFNDKVFADEFFTNRETFEKIDFTGQQMALFDYAFLNSEVLSENAKQEIITKLDADRTSIMEDLEALPESAKTSEALDNWYQILKAKSSSFTDVIQDTITELGKQFEASGELDFSSLTADQKRALEEYQFALQQVYGENYKLFEELNFNEED